MELEKGLSHCKYWNFYIVSEHRRRNFKKVAEKYGSDTIMDLSDGGDQNYKAIKWDEKMTEARRTLDWEKQINLSIDP